MIHSTVQPASVHEVRSRIAELRRIDLRSANIDIIKPLLEPLFRGIPIATPVLMPGQILYRGVRWSEKPEKTSHISYPPSDFVTTLQRVNREHEPMFYCSVAKEAVFFELGLNPGDYLAVSKWRLSQKILVNNAGYHNEVFKDLDSQRGSVPWWQEKNPLARTAGENMCLKFVAQEFARTVKSGDEYLYKMSVAIAEKLYKGDLDMGVVGREDFSGNRKFGGIIYPSISMRANADNLALLPEFVDQFLVPISTEWIRVDEQRSDQKIQITNLDFADSFGVDGRIEWKGRNAHWVVASGEEVQVSVESDKYVVRDRRGNVIQPS